MADVQPIAPKKGYIIVSATFDILPVVVGMEGDVIAVRRSTMDVAVQLRGRRREGCFAALTAYTGLSQPLC